MLVKNLYDFLCFLQFRDNDVMDSAFVTFEETMIKKFNTKYSHRFINVILIQSFRPWDLSDYFTSQSTGCLKVRVENKMNQCKQSLKKYCIKRSTLISLYSELSRRLNGGAMYQNQLYTGTVLSSYIFKVACAFSLV